MADVRCPMCGKSNSSDLDVCQYCGARLKPLLGSSGPESIQPGEEPVERDTSEFEKAKPTRPESIHPGEKPTQKNTSDLEHALPSWLRSLRGGEETPEEDSGKPAASDSSSEPPASSGGLPDWLSGLDKASAEGEEEVPDWLAGLRSDNPGSLQNPAVPEETGAQAQMDDQDWMARLGSSDQQASSGNAQPPEGTPSTPAANEDTPDWLKSLENPTPAASEPPVVRASGDSTPDWLKSLETPAPSSSETPAVPASGDDTPDWLKSLETPAPSSSETPAVPASGDDTPDWLKSLETPAPSSSETPAVPASGDDTSDWLKSLGTPAPSSSETPAVVASGDSTSDDWLKSLENPTPTAPEPPAAPASDDTTPDWLKSLQSASSTPTEEPPSGKKGEGNLPDWFAGLPGISAEEPPAAPTPPAGRTDNLPDWLSQLEEKGAAPAGAPFDAQPDEAFQQPAEPGSSEPGLPDWLSQLQEKTAPGALSPSEAPADSGSPEPPAMDNLPDWLNVLQDKTTGPEPSVPGLGDQNTPDWLSRFNQESSPAAPTSDANKPDWLSNLEAGSGASSEAPRQKGAPPVQPPTETPDWLSHLQADMSGGESTPPGVESSFKPEKPKETGPLPGWLSGIDRTASTSGGTPALIGDEKDLTPETPAEAAYSTETPDWLSSVKPEPGTEKPAKTEAEQQQQPADLEAAALPSWVQAMRPLESVVSDVSAGTMGQEKVTEQSGPLAGLSGVLPTGPGLGTLRKPPAYSVKLHLSETQQQYVGEFDRLVAEETKTHSSAAGRLSSNRMWRWLIAVFLLAAVSLPFIFKVPLTPPSELISSDTAFGDNEGASAKIVDAIPAGSPVLMVFDYDPALSSEVEAASAPLVDQLMAKNVRLALVSTSTTGPGLAQNFIQNALLVNSHNYQEGQQYVQLGYLPGGPAAIASFAADPRSTAPVPTSGGAWDGSALQDIHRLSDFTAVFILTDNADLGRMWIEQAGPYLGSSPMVMVASAQAEPMIRPYFDSGQLKGLVSGVLDAKIYEQYFNRPGLANQYWDSYSLGMLAAEILIILGALWSAINSWRPGRKSSGEKA